MNEIMYSFRDANDLRTIINGDKTWFNAKDVCEILELVNVSQAVSRLEEDERCMFNIGRAGQAYFVNEYGLYTLILGSRKPEAKEFKRWVTHEVIPSIRKHGAYLTTETAEKWISDPESMIKVLQALQSERNKKIKLENELQAAQPKLFFAEAVGESDSTISINNLAKLISQNGYKIGEIRLFEWLRNNHYLIRERGMDYNTPRQAYINQGLFVIKESVHVGAKGAKISKTTRVTGKGQLYFINKFLNYEKSLKELN